jgi:cation/acetate symporter
VAAGGLAAALSTAAGLLLAISSAISHDLIKGSINPNISEKGELLAARISMAFAIALATWLGLNPPGFAAQVVALAFGLAAATIFPVLMMGIFSKRINKEGAIAGMLVGLCSRPSTSSSTWAGSSSPAPTTCQHPGQPLLRHLAAVDRDRGRVVNFVVGLCRLDGHKAPPAHVVDLVESIRVPKGAGGQAH